MRERLHSKWHWILGLILVVYPFLWIWQGLDFTDTGFSITNYNLIFQAPHSIHYWAFNYWLTDVVGGLWLHAFGDLGLFGIRLLSALLMVTTNLVAYRSFRGWMVRGPLLVSMLLGETLIERMYWLNYDNLSAFLFVVMGVLLIHGLVKQRSWPFAVAGLVLGINAFVRVTNVAGFVIAMAIVVHGTAHRTPIRQQLGNFVGFLAGGTVGVASVLALMHGLGQTADFFANLNTLFSIAGGHANTHSSSRLLVELRRDEVAAGLAAVFGFLFMAWIALGNFVLARVKPHWTQPVFQVLSALTAAAFLYETFLRSRYLLVADLTGVLYGLLFLGFVIGARRKAARLTAASVVSMLILFAEPLGSDLGIRIAVYGMYLALPVAMHVLWSVLPTLRVSANGQRGLFNDRWAAGLLILQMFAVGIITGYQYTYRDVSARLTMTAPLENPKLRGVYTTPARATVVNELFAALPRFVKPGDAIMSYEETSLVYYVTDTLPYMDASWPMLHDPVSFRHALQQAEETHKRLPVVVRAKAATADFNWPNVHQLRIDYRHDEDRKIMTQFLRENHYAVAWENSFFEILVPPSQT